MGKFKMKKPNPKGIKSPLKDGKSKKTEKDEKSKKTDIDTTWADQIYTKNKIDESLKSMGHHTEGNLRGDVNTDPGSKEVGGRNQILGSSEMY